MGTVQKWLLYMAGLGALALVVANPTGVLKAAQAVQTIVGGTETQIITAKTKK
jgi:hypothetical protein